MKLYKNVDVYDLESILEKGIISIDELGESNWDDRKRVNNATDKVYLFADGVRSSFPDYGIALLEIEMPESEIQQNEMSERDYNRNNYKEFICDHVAPEQIKAIYCPTIFKDSIAFNVKNKEVFNKITFVEITATYYNGDLGKTKAPAELLKKFGQDAEINTFNYMFFRGYHENGHVLDLYDVNYLI